jgi:hypothetical protein
MLSEIVRLTTHKQLAASFFVVLDCKRHDAAKTVSPGQEQRQHLGVRPPGARQIASQGRQPSGSVLTN